VVSPNGRLVASGGADKAIHLWDTGTWRELSPALTGHTGQIRALAFSPDGKMLASGGDDQLVMVWHVGSGKPVATFSGHAGIVRSVAFGLDGQVLASGADGDPEVRLWDVSGRKGRSHWKAHEGGVHALAFAPNGQTLVSGGADKSLRYWDAATGNELVSFRRHTSDIISVAYSGDGKKVASGTIKGVLRVGSPETEKNRKLGFKDSRDSISALAFSPDSKWLAATEARRTIVLWDMDTMRPVREASCAAPIYGLAFGPHGDYLVAATDDGKAYVFRAAPVTGIKPRK
jgi:WD40 repeat protein